ncbi:MAG TPA: hypothetical protein VFX86_00685 [Candidatus Saccharimonadales bacterium]|nr:hypothetical protein [Candidatus Saccharimonadales bacterium]
MKERKTARKSQASRVKHLRPRSLTYYLKATKATKKIGSIATNGFFQVRDFLVKEIPLPSARDITGSLTGFFNRSPVLSGRTETASAKQPSEKNGNKKNNNSFEDDDLETIVKNSNEVLAEATTVFPFTLFPDTVTVDRTKLTITQRTFFWSGKVTTIHIEDVLNISANVGPLFGSLTIAIKGLTSEDHYSINYFWRKDAIHLKHIIQGHMMAQHDKIDYRHLEHQKLIRTLLELGQDSNPE